MPQPKSPALEVSDRLLTGLRRLTVLYGIGILALLVASLVAPDFVFRALGVTTGAARDALVRSARAIMVFGLAGAVAVWVILTHLLAIVDTVRHGDPFVTGNAKRLRTIAWWVLGAEVLHLLVGVIVKAGSTSGEALNIDWTFSFMPWVTVVLLFVLARVFEHGARMRADLEGTV